jgi:hypothetical protein
VPHCARNATGGRPVSRMPIVMAATCHGLGQTGSRRTSACPGWPPSLAPPIAGLNAAGSRCAAFELVERADGPLDTLLALRCGGLPQPLQPPGGAGLGAYTTALPAWAVRHRGRFARRATTGQGVAPRPDCVRRSSERPTPPATSAVSSRLAGSMNPARAGLRSGRPKCRRGSSACRLTAVPERGAFGWRQVRAESDQGADGQPPK